MQSDPLRSSNDTLFDKWRTVDRTARDIERSLARSLLLALDGVGELPSAELRARARQWRQAANDLLALTLSDMKARAHSSCGH